MDIIGHPFEEIASDAKELRFRHYGSFGGLAQAAFVALLAPVLYFAVDSLAAWLVLGLAVVLAAGFVFNGLIAWELRFDLERREYELWRGLRRLRRRVAGAFDDFEKVHVAPGWYSGLCVYLVPGGSQRGYDLYRNLDAEGARRKAGWLGEKLGVPVELAQPRPRWKPVPADLHFPPAGLPVAVSRAGDGVRIELPPQRGLWRYWVRVDPGGIEIGLDFAPPWGRRRPSSSRVAWKDIVQIIVSNVLSGRNEGSSWRIRRDWRQDMHALWKQHCNELKQAESPLPWWGPLWYFYEGRLREYEKTVCVFRKGRPYLSVGSNWELGDEGLLWLYSGIVRRGREHGARFTTRS